MSPPQFTLLLLKTGNRRHGYNFTQYLKNTSRGGHRCMSETLKISIGYKWTVSISLRQSSPGLVFGSALQFRECSRLSNNSPDRVSLKASLDFGQSSGGGSERSSQSSGGGSERSSQSSFASIKRSRREMRERPGHYKEYLELSTRLSKGCTLS